MKTVSVSLPSDRVRLLGRMNPGQIPPALDWTGTGAEFCFRGSCVWAELEATAFSPIFWMIVLADGCPVARFPVEPGCRFYPLVLGMEPDKTREITLMKETQCMPASPEATVKLWSLRHDGELLPLRPRRYQIEFIGDSLTSGEGTLAPGGNEEWITLWFSARANYAWIAGRELDAEVRMLSQSGYGVCWDWEHTEANNMSGGYDRTVGVLFGPEAEKRGCRQAWDFSSWQPDCVCIRLTTNDVNGMRMRGTTEQDRETLIRGCTELIRKVRQHNPKARIVWILPGSDSCPELAAEAVRRAREEISGQIDTFTLPDYTEADYGARAHPNAAWNRKAGLLLAEYLRTVL